MKRFPFVLLASVALWTAACAAKTPVPAPTVAPVAVTAPQETVAPADAAAFPMPIAAFAGYGSVDFGGLTMSCWENDCESGPAERAPKMTAEKLLSLTVTGKDSDLAVTGGTVTYRFSDADGKTVAAFEFYDDLLVRDDGMYALTRREGGAQ
ncbi:MAG: hypothetical protein Q4C53_02920 [Clostridia bacterium]|nr:hypothetical protein [Clostridia bacterium]